MKFSIIIASKDNDNPKLRECLRSIEEQDYPKDDVEVLVITEGTPESAKAIGLKRSTGEIICFMASDCEFIYKNTLREVEGSIQNGYAFGAYSFYYYYTKSDYILNRYFALFGFNDPVPFYLGKCDRHPHYKRQTIYRINFWKRNIPTLGDNGFFIRKDLIMRTDLDHYSHIDNCEDLRKIGYYHYALLTIPIHHKTGDNLWLWIKKRFYYAESLNQNRRWKMFSSPKDIVLLLLFILFSLTMAEPLLRGIYGYTKSGIKDKAWFLHPIICFITVFLYGALCLKFLLLYVRKTVRGN